MVFRPLALNWRINRDLFVILLDIYILASSLVITLLRREMRGLIRDLNSSRKFAIVLLRSYDEMGCVLSDWPEVT